MGASIYKEPKLFIFSTYRFSRTKEENEDNHAMMARFFTEKGIPFVPVVGKYKGNMEQAFLVSASAVPEEAVLYYSRHYHQDEYMVLDGHKHGTYVASMVNCATREQKQIGFMRSMPEAEVVLLGMDYTYRPDMNEYWVVWNTDTTVMTTFAEEKVMMRKPMMLSPEQEPFGTPAYC